MGLQYYSPITFRISRWLLSSFLAYKWSNFLVRKLKSEVCHRLNTNLNYTSSKSYFSSLPLLTREFDSFCPKINRLAFQDNCKNHPAIHGLNYLMFGSESLRDLVGGMSVWRAKKENNLLSLFVLICTSSAHSLCHAKEPSLHTSHNFLNPFWEIHLLLFFLFSRSFKT